MIDSPWAQLIGLAMFPAVYLIGNIIQALVCAFLDVCFPLKRELKHSKREIQRRTRRVLNREVAQDDRE